MMWKHLQYSNNVHECDTCKFHILNGDQSKHARCEGIHPWILDYIDRRFEGTVGCRHSNWEHTYDSIELSATARGAIDTIVLPKELVRDNHTSIIYMTLGTSGGSSGSTT